MKKMLISCLLALYPYTVNADVFQFDGYCDNTDRLINENTTTFHEEIAMVGTGTMVIANEPVKSIMTLWLNDTRKTWTIMATISDTVSCIMTSGNYYEIIQKK